MNWRCPRCGCMDIESRGEMKHCPFGGVMRNFKCVPCLQSFCVVDDGKPLNEAFDPERLRAPSTGQTLSEPSD